MIKIIKQGYTGKTKRIYEYSCIICGCVFEFERNDLDADNYDECAIRCPCCETMLGVVLEKTKSKLVESEVNKDE